MMDRIRMMLAKIDIGGQVDKIEGGDVSLEVSVRNILSVVFTLVGVIAVVMIVVGGIYYIISQGNADKIQKAKGTILYGIVGLIVTLLAFAIVNFVLEGL